MYDNNDSFFYILYQVKKNAFKFKNQTIIILLILRYVIVKLEVHDKSVNNVFAVTFLCLSSLFGLSWILISNFIWHVYALEKSNRFTIDDWNRMFSSIVSHYALIFIFHYIIPLLLAFFVNLKLVSIYYRDN